MPSRSNSNTKKTRLRLLHQYYSYTGFYKFVRSSMLKAAVPIILFVGLIWVLDAFVIDFEALFAHVTTHFSPFSVLAVFFASESFLGLIPPEIFIAWAGKTNSPVLFLSLLALLSYLGGVVSYGIGKVIASIPAVNNYFDQKMDKYIKMIRRWGGFLIVVGALLPVPFSITSIAAGIIRYNFVYYLLFGLLRFVRFYAYAAVIFNLV